MHIELDFAYTVEDIKEYRSASFGIYRAISAKDPKARRALTRTLFFTLTLILVVLLLVIFKTEKAPSPSPPVATFRYAEALPGLLPYLIPIIVFWGFIVWAIRTAPRRGFQKDPNLGAMRRVILTDVAMTIQLPTLTTVLAWTHFVHFAETRNLLVLMMDRQSAQIIPKRAFSHPERLQEFLAFAQAHVGYRPGGFPVIPSVGVIETPPSPKMDR